MGKRGPKKGTKLSALHRLRLSAAGKGNKNASGHRVTAKQAANLRLRWRKQKGGSSGRDHQQ